jgi:hypothetical protein
MSELLKLANSILNSLQPDVELDSEDYLFRYILLLKK